MPPIHTILLYAAAYLAIGCAVFGLYLSFSEETQFERAIDGIFHGFVTVLFWPAHVVIVSSYLAGKIILFLLLTVYRFFT